MLFMFYLMFMYVIHHAIVQFRILQLEVTSKILFLEVASLSYVHVQCLCYLSYVHFQITIHDVNYNLQVTVQYLFTIAQFTNLLIYLSCIH